MMERVSDKMERFFFKALLMVEIGICYIFGSTDNQNISEIIEDKAVRSIFPKYTSMFL